MSSLRSFGPETATLAPDPRFGLRRPEEVGAMVVEAIRENRFMVPTDDVAPLLIERAGDWDGFIDRRIAMTRPAPAE
jgi:hypothetical protein